MTFELISVSGLSKGFLNLDLAFMSTQNVIWFALSGGFWWPLKGPVEIMKKKKKTIQTG